MKAVEFTSGSLLTTASEAKLVEFMGGNFSTTARPWPAK